MSDFLIQKDNISTFDLEKNMLLSEIKKSHGLHTMKELALSEINENLENLIPVGTIEFVSKYMNVYYGLGKENPIEIPEYLLTDEFLKRKYKIIKGGELPRKGYWFIKNAETLKNLSYIGELEWFLYDEMFEEPKTKYDSTIRIKKDELYILSSNFSPKSEYRTYVFNGEIKSIAHYLGNPLLLPDVKLLKKAVKLINENEPFLKSYTVDLMINEDGETAIIEIHNFTSCGIYTNTISEDLPWAYKQGIEYLIYDNSKRIKEFSNF